jgi:DNA-directed RNA polymerase subunit RPC12/RpoP
MFPKCFFDMGNRRIDTTFCFARAKADCRVECRACGHTLFVTPSAIAEAFPTPMPIKAAERRLRCTACGEKRARMIPIPMATR